MDKKDIVAGEEGEEESTNLSKMAKILTRAHINVEETMRRRLNLASLLGED